MTTLESRIQSASAQNTSLLRTLSSTDHAAPSLAQQERLIADLETSLAESDRRVDYMAKRRLKEFHDHERYRDSVMRRFAYKATGRGDRFAERAAKEEKEYFAALQVEHQDQATNQAIRAQLADARAVAEELRQAVKTHEEAQKELDTLYDSLFAGTTPEMPEEDAREREVGLAARAYHDVRGRAEAELVAAQLLATGQRRMRDAVGSMETALSASRLDMFSSNSFADMMERNALHRAENDVAAARMAVAQARRMNPLVADLPLVDINHGHLVRDLFFDNIFTDMAFHEEIKRSAAGVVQAAEYLDVMAAEAQSRHRALDVELKKREEELQEARVALQKEREDAFERFGKK